ncbi:MAG: hypothetical protein WDO73_06480 [Ignavibacteriota bacterium]
MRKIRRGLGLAAAALVLLYGGDYVSAKFRLPGDRQTLGSVDVQVMWAIRQKNGRIDYELGGTETRPCLYSLFPHLGYTPCWYLARHKNQTIKVGSANREFSRPSALSYRLPPVFRDNVNSCRFPIELPEPIFCSSFS